MAMFEKVDIFLFWYTYACLFFTIKSINIWERCRIHLRQQTQTVDPPFPAHRRSLQYPSTSTTMLSTFGNIVLPLSDIFSDIPYIPHSLSVCCFTLVSISIISIIYFCVFWPAGISLRFIHVRGSRTRTVPCTLSVLNTLGCGNPGLNCGSKQLYSPTDIFLKVRTLFIQHTFHQTTVYFLLG